ncbi:MAG: transglutaminase-like domain-containing protein [Candidatus Omnitrophota bacterium]
MRIFKRHAVLTLSLVITSHICAWAENILPPTPIETFQVSQSDIDKKFIALFLKKQNIRNLDEYILWFKKNIHYKSDGGSDQWSTPIETILRRSGDCEDLAFLNKTVLEVFGIESKVLGTQKGSDHHVFCVFQYNQRIYIFDNTNYIKTKAESVEEIAIFLYEKYNINYLLEVSLYPRSVSLLYSKNMLRNFSKSAHINPAI